MRTIVALGATSAIVAATLKNFAKEGDRILLVGRDGRKLSSIKDDLTARGASALEVMEVDLGENGAETRVLSEAKARFNEVDIVYIGYGTLTDTKRAEHDTGYALSELHANFGSIMAHCLVWANYFEERRLGTIAVVSSVAGDRGRQSNYVYGAAKGGLSTFLAGLRNRLARSEVSVVTIKPGFVDTPMTASMKKGPLFVSSDVAGEIIYRAILAKKEVVYTPWFWRVIMMIICSIPEKIFKKLSL